MSTSIRDLLDAAHDELNRHAVSAVVVTGTPATFNASTLEARTPEAAQVALTTVAAAASILTGVRVDGVVRGAADTREHAVAALATACTAVARSCDGLVPARAAQLLGASGDAMSRFRGDATHADRWAFALAVGDVVRHATSLYRDHGPQAPNRHMQWARGAAVTLAREGARQPPAPRNLAVQDRPIPAPTVDPDASPLSIAAQAIDNITHHLRRSTGPQQQDMPVSGLRTVASVALVCARYVAAVGRHNSPDDIPHRELVEEWISVRHGLHGVDDGLGPTADPRVLPWAIRAHEGLSRALGPADQLTAHHLNKLTTADRSHLTDIAAQLHQTALLLHSSVRRSAPLYARATELRFTEDRAAAVTGNRVIAMADHDYEHLDARILRAAHVTNTIVDRLASEHRGHSGAADLRDAQLAGDASLFGGTEPFALAASTRLAPRPSPARLASDHLPRGGGTPDR